MFLIIWDPFGPVWTLSDHFKQKMIFCLKAPPPNPTLPLRGNKSIFVWNGPKVSRRAQKGWKLSKTSRFTIFDPFGPLWTPLECWQACRVWPFLFVLLLTFFGTPCMSVSLSLYLCSLHFWIAFWSFTLRSFVFLSVRLSVTGVTSQLFLIIWWFRP